MAVVIDLGGRTALVTGAAGGLGHACARALLEAGARVAITDLPGARLEAAAERLRADFGSQAVVGLASDLTASGAPQALLDEAVAHLGSLSALVNCAGIMETVPLREVTEQAWRRIIDVNVTATFLLTQAAASWMADHGGGSVVTLSSVAGRSGRANAVHYAASKAALLSMTQSAALAYAPAVRVNAVCPGVFMTQMWEQIIADRTERFGEGAGDAYFAEITKACALGREGAEAELASVVLFLVSDLASYVTGQAVNVDGGLEMD